jgi:hypothetical protein
MKNKYLLIVATLFISSSLYPSYLPWRLIRKDNEEVEVFNKLKNIIFDQKSNTFKQMATCMQQFDITKDILWDYIYQLWQQQIINVIVITENDLTTVVGGLLWHYHLGAEEEKKYSQDIITQMMNRQALDHEQLRQSRNKEGIDIVLCVGSHEDIKNKALNLLLTTEDKKILYSTKVYTDVEKEWYQSRKFDVITQCDHCNSTYLQFSLIKRDQTHLENDAE